MAARPTYSDAELLTAIAAVASAACPDEPHALSQPVFDNSRDAVADKYPGLPTARAIYMRLNSGNQGTVKWRKLVRAAVKGGHSAQQTLVAGRRSEVVVPLTEESIFFALQLVARELNSRAPSPGQYDTKADELRRTRRGALSKLLPSSSQLQQYAGGWDEALALGELESRAAARAQPRAQRPDAKPGSVPIVDALGYFLEQEGWLPAKHDLRWFAKTAGFALADDRNWGNHITKFRLKRSKVGAWCPPRPPRGGDRVRVAPDLTLLPDDLPVPKSARGWSEEGCVDAVVDYWDQLPAGTEPRATKYGTWAVGKKYPAKARFAEHGGFKVIRELARAKRRQRDG